MIYRTVSRIVRDSRLKGSQLDHVEKVQTKRTGEMIGGEACGEGSQRKAWVVPVVQLFRNTTRIPV